MQKYTNLPRAVDLSYRSNALIAGISVIMFVIGWMVTQSVNTAFGWLWLPFVAWTIAREIDPDREWQAFIAVGFGIVAAVIWGMPNFSIAVFLMFSVRLMVGSVSQKFHSTDFLALGIFLSWIIYSLRSSSITLPSSPEWIIAGLVALVMVIKIFRIDPVSSKTDLDGEKLCPDRLRTSRLVALLIAAIPLCIAGQIPTAMYLWFIFWGSILG